METEGILSIMLFLDKLNSNNLKAELISDSNFSVFMAFSNIKNEDTNKEGIDHIISFHNHKIIKRNKVILNRLLSPIREKENVDQKR